MAKFKLQPAPTFKRKVEITTHEGKVAELEFTFRHRDRKSVVGISEEIKGKSDVEVIKLVASAWELEDPFDDEHLGQLVDNYLSAAEEVFNGYLTALRGAREGN